LIATSKPILKTNNRQVHFKVLTNISGP